MNRWACICRLGGVGDNLVASSVMRPLKKLGYMTEMVTSEMASAVFLNNPYIDKLTVRPDGMMPGGPDWFAARAPEYDVFVNLSFSMEGLHAVRKNEPLFYWPPEFRRRRCGGSYLETAHDIVGVPHEFGPLFFPTAEERERAAADKKKQFGGRYVLWALAGSRIDKTHPFIPHAVARIIKELDVHVVLMGHGDAQYQFANMVQTEVARTLSTDRGHRCLSAVTPPEQIGLGIEDGGPRHWSLRRSLSTALAADVVITPDSGIGWAVAMEAMPKVMLLSHASVENITKHWVNATTLHADQNRVPCWPCHCLHDTIDTCVKAKNAEPATAAACIADIPVDDIVNAVDAALHPKGNVVRLEAAE